MRQRRVVAAAAVALLLLVVALGTSALGGGDGEEKRPAERAHVPRSIFPEQRVVAFYGAPQDRQLGALGVGSPAQAARRLARQARPYARAGRPVLPAFELIATVADAHPGDDGNYSTRQSPATIRRYLRAARREEALLILDIQPGHASFMEEVRALDPFLREPDVSLALDPEWSLREGQVPGSQIGSTDAETVNEVSRHLARIVREERLPEKLLVVHRFTTDMIAGESELEEQPGVALTVNVDGFGSRPVKRAKYHEFTRSGRHRFDGFKLFYEEDTNLMTPAQVLRLRPSPDLIVYE